MRITSITPMKDEAPFLLEWVAYHRLIGLNDIHVFSNDCSDGTDLMLERLDDLGLLRHYSNPSMIMDAQNHHQQMLRYVNTWPRLRRSDWVVNMDVDEYICVNAGRGRITDLFDAVPAANMIVMSQHNFGCGGIETYEDKLLTEQFRWSWSLDAAYHRKLNRRGTKTLTHASAEALQWRNHSPVFEAGKTDRVRPVNGSGEDLTGLDLTEDVKSLLAPDYGFGLVQLNHYVLKSVDAFFLKVARGNANHPDKDYAMGYWRRYDHNHHHDENIARWQDDVRAFRDELIADAELGPLHHAAVARAHETIAAVKATEAGVALSNHLRRYRSRNPVGGDRADDGEGPARQAV
ncbi:glycosyltransferase family 2 protein [Histidinibacterium lentulum]|uniref:Glycosyltransferase family 2 protein n=1 Tax=Histidinibacterium lentulum TaxID=2480588 RepID=A0A3N2QY34_9RHOB|nr:glycosyltransferase family 2 protein [Histidinibacterium lentulum]ROU00101.1 glycosyltransferase family 2 protein [Histidinibacterium lentulum]